MGRYITKVDTINSFSTINLFSTGTNTFFLTKAIAFVNLPSIAEYVQPQLSLELSDEEKTELVYSAYKTNKGFLAEIFISPAGNQSDGHLLTSFLTWNRRPGYSKDILADLNQGETLVISPGFDVFLRLSSWNQSTINSALDSISFFLTLYEEISP